MKLMRFIGGDETVSIPTGSWLFCQPYEIRENDKDYLSIGAIVGEVVYFPFGFDTFLWSDEVEDIIGGFYIEKLN